MVVTVSLSAECLNPWVRFQCYFFFFFFPELGLNELLVSFPSGSLRLSSMGQELCVIHGKPGWLSAEKPSVL